MPIALKRATLPLGAVAIALGLSACGATTPSTSGYSGEAHAVAQTIANLQSDLSSSNQKKVCANDLSAAVVQSLGGTSGCEAAIKRQLEEIENLELGVNSIKVLSATTAEATARSIYEGKTRLNHLTLVKEGGKWKISTSKRLPVATKTKK
jgi:hypothetical protein